MKNRSLRKRMLQLFILISPIYLIGSVEDLDKFIEKEMAAQQVPGVSVVIVQNDKPFFVKGYGVAEVGTGQYIDGDTIFQIASVSKTFTAGGLAVQVDNKQLDWDDEIIAHLPEAVLHDYYATRYLTSRDLLAHRTGLPGFRGDLLGWVGYNREEVLFRIRNMQPAESFRNKGQYSNINYFVAGALLEKLTKTSWEKAIQETIFNPLKMNRSGFNTNLENTNVALPHAKVGGKIKVIPRDDSVVFVAAGGVNSTAKDLGNWMIMHLNEGRFEGKQVLSKDVINEMHAPSMIVKATFTDSPPIDENSSLSFGLGWNNYNYKGKVIVEKGGALDGVRAVITMIPELKVGIAVLANLNLTILPEMIRAKFLEEYLGESGQNIEGGFDRQKELIAELMAPAKIPADALPPGHSIEKYAGTFTNDLYGDFKIASSGKDLFLKAGPKGYPANLSHFGNNTFILSWPLINAGHELVTFIFGPEGDVTELQTETLGTFVLNRFLEAKTIGGHDEA